MLKVFEPTINRLASEQHIRTATGRDYADVPPTMGMMKGKADTQLQVRVRVTPSQAVLPPTRSLRQTKSGRNFLTRPNNLSRPRLSNSSRVRRESGGCTVQPLLLKMYKELATPDLFLQGEGAKMR